MTSIDSTYEKIRDTVRLAAPFFDDFKFRPRPSNGDTTLQLEWTQKGSDYPFLVTQLSDGTFRFIALTTALLQPDPPTTILLDEPELGLHPYALTLLAALLKKAATRTQVIVSTQSASLLDNFEAEDVIVVEREDGAIDVQASVLGRIGGMAEGLFARRTVGEEHIRRETIG